MQLNDKLIANIITKAESSNKKEEIFKYISEVAARCVALCNKGEHLRVLGEYKFLIDNLRKEFDL